MNRLLSFRGGTHPPEGKERTAGKAIERAAAPPVVTIPLKQHIGQICEPLVSVGSRVKAGQKIGERKDALSVPVHASVSGTVRAVGDAPHPVDGRGPAISIENDGLDTPAEVIGRADPEDMSPGDIVQAVYEAGIVGMGGAAFPTYAKLTPPSDKPMRTVVLNGAECEPYLTADHRLMLEQPEDIIFGLKAIMKAVGAELGYIGIENNKADAVRAMIAAAAAEKSIRVVSLRTKYPQGAEKQLINVITGEEVPSGGLPHDIGVVVNNVGTAAAVAAALRTGRPLIERVVTVTGTIVREPKNLLVKMGTSFGDLLEQCGGTTEEPAKMLSGGPMMGIAQTDYAAPVIKGTSGIVVLSAAEAVAPPDSPCIRCGRCAEACPMRLMPLTLDAMAAKGDYDACREAGVLDCIECGSCSFVCPSKRRLLESIREGKAAVKDRMKSKR